MITVDESSLEGLQSGSIQIQIWIFELVIRETMGQVLKIECILMVSLLSFCQWKWKSETGKTSD